MEQPKRKRITFDPAKINDRRRQYMYLDTIREALHYLLEHEMPAELVNVCEGYGWIVGGEWNFTGMCKHDIANLYCTIKNLLEEAKR